MANNKVYADYLMHGRTKGSRNGISTTKGYTAVGQKAKGRWINGRYVYELGAQGSYRPGAVNSRNGRYGRYVYDTMTNNPNNWQQQANAAASGKSHGYNNAHYNAVNQAAAERKAREAALARQRKASNKKSSILAGVRMIPTNNPKDKYDYSGKNDDRAPVFKEATYIDLYGNKTGGKVTKMDRTPYWDHMANAKTNKEFDKYAKKSKEFLDDFRASKIRNSRSDIGNAFADAKEDAKNLFKKLKSKFKKK